MSFTKYYLNNSKTRWCYLGSEGEKSKVHFTTKEGKKITRSAQFFEEVEGEVLVMVSYKGESIQVKSNSVLDS